MSQNLEKISLPPNFLTGTPMTAAVSAGLKYALEYS